MTGSRQAAVVHVAGSLLAVALFQMAGRSRDHVDPFLLLYGMGPLAALGCVLGVSRLWSSLPHPLERATAVLWVLSLITCALSQRLWEVAYEAADASLIRLQAVILWCAAIAMLASSARGIWSGSTSRLSRIVESSAFAVLGLSLAYSGTLVWTSLGTGGHSLAVILEEARLRAYVAVGSTIGFGLAAGTAWFSGRMSA